MADTNNRDRFRGVLTLILLGLLGVHIVIAILFLLTPGAKFRKEVQLYRAFTHIGPVFKSRTLTSSYHVIVRVRHADGTRENIDLTERLQTGYHSNAAKVHLLYKKFYIRNVASSLSRNLSAESAIPSDTLRTRIHQIGEFIREEVDLQPGDSVWCGFVWKKYWPSERRYKADTLVYLPIPIAHD